MLLVTVQTAVRSATAPMSEWFPASATRTAFTLAARHIERLGQFAVSPMPSGTYAARPRRDDGLGLTGDVHVGPRSHVTRGRGIESARRHGRDGALGTVVQELQGEIDPSRRRLAAGPTVRRAGDSPSRSGRPPRTRVGRRSDGDVGSSLRPPRPTRRPRPRRSLRARRQ
jgi:hypothetical protein